MFAFYIWVTLVVPLSAMLELRFWNFCWTTADRHDNDYGITSVPAIKAD